MEHYGHQLQCCSPFFPLNKQSSYGLMPNSNIHVEEVKNTVGARGHVLS